ncbi:MAG: PAS domain S-box protein [Dehalococcoidales bacterium]|nr:MAG: PAS domain S-box protein [Dehalococcoidales bacterium]
MAETLQDTSMLARIIDGSSIPSFVINLEHKVIYWNTAIESLSGIKREEIIGTNEQWRAFYKEKRPTMADLIVDEASAKEIESYYPNSYEQSRLIEGAYEAENFFADMGSNGRWLHFTGSPIKDASETIIGAIETLEDITERRVVEDALLESEKSYRAIFESAYDAIWVHDMDGIILTANDALSVLCGYPLNELVGMSVKQFIGNESDIELAREIKKKLLSGGRIDAPYEMNLVRKDGTKLITIITTNLVNVENDVKAFQNTARDVTNEKRMEENLRYYLQQITRAQEEERKRIARELHDDTAQLLLSLSRQLDNFIRNEDNYSREHISFLKDIQEQVNRGVQSVHRYAQDLRPSLIDDLGLMAAVRSLVKRAQEYSEIEISLEVTGEERRLPSEVEMLLYRIIQEALNNVLKHSRATESHIDIQFSEKQVYVSISDNGTGFELSDTIDDLAQTGKLGLIGMQERARLLGATLSFDSVPSKGTSVLIDLPY